MILYTDKNELFECNISVDGTSLDNTKARIVLESNKWNLVFYGKVDSLGKCSINISKLNILNEGEYGNMRLEVIADDSLFIPWEDEFSVKKSKKVTVEVINKQSTNIIENNKNDRMKVVVSNIHNKIEDDKKDIISDLNNGLKTQAINETINKIKLNNINLKNFNTKSSLFEKIILEIATKYNIQSIKSRKEFTQSILDFLSK